MNTTQLHRQQYNNELQCETPLQDITPMNNNKEYLKARKSGSIHQPINASNTNSSHQTFNIQIQPKQLIVVTIY
jgi:hypothetical protein